MQIKVPKNDKYQWTQHSLYKMQQYGLSPQRVVRVIRNPQRLEEGIVPKTIAVMQPTSVSTKKGERVWNSEIWCMYQIRSKNKEARNKKDFKNIYASEFMVHASAKPQLRIISAWRYPGVSPKNNPIPEEILQELAEIA